MKLRIAFLAVAAMFVAAAVQPSPVSQPDDEQLLVSWTNQEREKEGRKPLALAGSLAKLAREQARRMAEDGTIYHNQGLDERAMPHCGVGENVGMGPTVGSIHDAWLESPGHLANILGNWSIFGVGVYEHAETVYAAVVFKLSCPSPTPTEKNHTPKKTVEKRASTPKKESGCG